MNAPEEGQVAVVDLSTVLITLLKGVVYREDDARRWGALLRLQPRLREQAAILNVDLIVDDSEGYAFLKGRPDPEDGQPRALRLVARHALTYPVSLLLALLRKKQIEFDAGAGDTRLILNRDEIVEQVRVFLPEGPNEARLVDQIDATIQKVVDLGFMRRLKSSTGGADQFEVRRILKAYVDAQALADFEARLEQYRMVLADGEPT
ncbi:MAG: DUF4194 domain-containing protein [Burkholderiaceae bacterium]|nr:DUF4194 domain-containing protein [Burkholderiaceae bacterium]